MLSRKLPLALLTVFIVGACSILKKDDPEKDVRSFLASFQASLAKTDEEILEYFQVKQTKEAVLSVVRVLQNKESQFIICRADFNNAMVSIENQSVKVEISSAFTMNGIDSEDHDSTTLVLWLTAKDKNYRITKLEGEQFYQAYTSIRNRNEWAAQEKLAMQERALVYKTAKELEQKFDTVIWYAMYEQQPYFYVVQGTWKNYFMQYETRKLKNSDARMGLVNANGEIIIPLEYELIGTIGFGRPGLVEVKKKGKVGYFDLANKRVVVEPEFDMLVPYGVDNVLAVVKQDTAYGWLDDSYQHKTGFPSRRVEQWVNDFEFLKRSIRLKPDNHVFCEIPDAAYAGNGIIIPSSFLSAHGIFNEIEGGISTTSIPIHGWTDYKETTGSFFEQVTNKINAVVTTIRERYLDGREEFYESSTLVFFDHRNDTLNVATISATEITMHPIDSSLLEVRSPHDNWFMENEVCEEYNLLSYKYFAITPEGFVKPLLSKRLFPETEFVKLDSSYLLGDFQIYNNETQQMDLRGILSVKTLTYMRNEILASYGYSFPGKEDREWFTNRHSWYKPEYNSIEEFLDRMTDIDKHNLDFLNNAISSLESAMA